MSQGVRKISNPRGATQTLAMESFATKVCYEHRAHEHPPAS